MHSNEGQITNTDQMNKSLRSTFIHVNSLNFTLMYFAIESLRSDTTLKIANNY